MRRIFISIVVLSVFVSVSLNGFASQPKSYESLQQKSISVLDARRILLPFVKTCDREKTKFRRLFCEALNERLKSQHQSKMYEQTFSLEDQGPLELSYVAKPKPGFEIELKGCLTCNKPMLNRKGGDISKARFFVFKQPKSIRVKRGAKFDLVDIDMDKIDVPIKVDEVDEKPWNKKRFMNEIGQFVRLDMVYRPVAGVTKVKSGARYAYGVVNFEMVGYRIYNKCTGDIYKAQPAMSGKYKVDKNDLSCPQNRPDWGKKQIVLPPKLPEAETKSLMAGVEADLGACYNQFGQTGEFPVDILILGNGRVKDVKVMNENDSTPSGECVKRLIKNIRFPKFSGRKLHLPWPLKITD